MPGSLSRPAARREGEMADEVRPDPVTDALTGLVGEGTLTDAQAARVDAALRAAGVGRQRLGTATVAEVLTYLGAALSVGALALVVGWSWDELGQTGQVAVCGAITALFAGLAIAVGRWRGSVFAHRGSTVASVLAALAAMALTLTAFQVADAAGVADNAWTPVVVGAVAVAAGLGAYLAWHGAPSVLVVFAGGLIALAGLLDLVLGDHVGGDVSTYYGLVYYAYGLAWAGGGRFLRDPHPAGVLGGVAATATAEYLAFETPWLGLVLGLVAVAGMFTMFRLDRHWWYAAVGVLGALVVPASAVGQIWSGALAAVVLLVVGVALVTAALLLAGRGASA